MRITVTTLTDQIFTLEVSEDLELENVKAMCEFEIGVPATAMVMVWNGRPLLDGKKTLKDIGIVDGEMLLIQQVREQPPDPPQATGGTGITFKKKNSRKFGIEAENGCYFNFNKNHTKDICICSLIVCFAIWFPYVLFY